MLYHIRFFKVPTISIEASKKIHELTSVITITNDLGDSYFFGDVDLKVDLGGGLESTIVKWRSGAQSCSFNIKLPKRLTTGMISLSITADVDSVKDILDENPLFLPVSTLPFGVSNPCQKVALRYDLLSPIQKIAKESVSSPIPSLVIAEETGTHNLARHVWDAGLSTCQWLFDDDHKGILGNPKNIIELGTGCGLVGLALSKMFNQSSILLTDLEDAKDICERNIQLNFRTTNKRKREDTDNVLFKMFDWDNEDRTITSQCWDLVVVTDCTYNPSSYDSLLNAIDTVTTSGTKVLLAHKYRDSDEEEFFTRLKYQRDVDITINYNSQSVRLLLMTK